MRRRVAEWNGTKNGYDWFPPVTALLSTPVRDRCPATTVPWYPCRVPYRTIFPGSTWPTVDDILSRRLLGTNEQLEAVPGGALRTEDEGATVNIEHTYTWRVWERRRSCLWFYCAKNVAVQLDGAVVTVVVPTSKSEFEYCYHCFHRDDDDDGDNGVGTTTTAGVRFGQRLDDCTLSMREPNYC